MPLVAGAVLEEEDLIGPPVAGDAHRPGAPPPDEQRAAAGLVADGFHPPPPRPPEVGPEHGEAILQLRRVLPRLRPHHRRALDLPANEQQLAAGVHEVVQRHAEEGGRPRWLAVDHAVDAGHGRWLAVGGERHGEEVLVVVDGVELALVERRVFDPPPAVAAADGPRRRPRPAHRELAVPPFATTAATTSAAGDTASLSKDAAACGSPVFSRGATSACTTAGLARRRRRWGRGGHGDGTRWGAAPWRLPWRRGRRAGTRRRRGAGTGATRRRSRASRRRRAAGTAARPPGRSAEAAVGEAEARRQRRRRAVFPRGRAPRAARGAEADAVGVGREAAEDLAGDVQREVPPRRRRRRARRRRPRPFARPLHHLVCAQKRTNEGTQVVSQVSDTYIYSLLTISDSFTAYGIW